MDRVTAYAQSVVQGDVVAGRLHRLACQRHLADLERQGRPDFPYVWDGQRGLEIVNFGETLTIIEGSAPRPLTLFGCQVFDLATPMGWFHRDSGNRRFRRKYKSVARQNGKSMENGLTGTYIANFQPYKLGKLFTVATKKRQARIAWEEMQKFIEGDEDLSDLFRIQDYCSLITALDTGCTIEALSQEAGLDDGFRSIYASIDELHQHRDGSVYRAIYNGTRTLAETLISMITTRGTNLNSFCHEMDEYCVSVLEGIVADEELFVDIYALDEGDSPFDPAHFLKSNPVLCQMPGGLATMERDAQVAQSMGGSQLTDFLVKCQNQWVDSRAGAFLDGDLIRTMMVEATIEDFVGCPAYCGIDLSHGGDLTSISLELEVGDGCYFVWSHSFMPRGRLEEHKASDLAPYDLWEQEGLITVTGGVESYKNDYKFILKVLREALETYNIPLQGIGYDPHNADSFLSDLEDFGVPLLEVRQSAKFLNDATVDIQLLAKSGHYQFSKQDRLLAWSLRNAVLDTNSFGEIKLDKKNRTYRIDPADATVNGRTARMKLADVAKVDVNQAMKAYLEQRKG